MGFWGTYVLTRTEDDLDDLEIITDREDSLIDAEVRAAGWQLGQYDGQTLFDEAEGLLAELSAHTGAPALVAYCWDGDCFTMVGYDPVNGFWRAGLAREIAADYLAEHGVDFDQAYLEPVDAASAAIRWSAAASLQPLPDQLLADLSMERF